mgnify:CR=1 FL=1
MGRMRHLASTRGSEILKELERIPSKIDLRSREALIYLEDIYRGPGLKDVPRGAVKQTTLDEK